MDVNLIDLHVEGHHRSYLEMLSSFWSENTLEGVLRIFVSRRFMSIHDDFVAHPGERVTIVPLDVGEPSDVGASLGNMVRLDRMHSRALKHVSSSHQGPIVFMYFDDAQMAMAKFRGRPASVSGLYFRSPFQERESGRMSRGRAMRKDTVFKLAVRNKGLHRLFCLDPRDVVQVDRVAGRPIAVALPDGVQLGQPSTTRGCERSKLGAVESSRVFLMAGDICRRKGIVQLADAIKYMSDQDAEQVILVVAGRQRQNERELISNALGSIAERVRLIEIDRRVSDGKMAALFVASDVVLVPYTKDHVGSSGILIRSAAWGRPVVGPDVGLMAEHIRENRLGQTVDLSISGNLTDALHAAVNNPSVDFDEALALAFGRVNSASQFAARIFAELGCVNS